MADFKKYAEILVKRFSDETGEPSRTEALTVAQRFVQILVDVDVTFGKAGALLDAAGTLPAGTDFDSLRSDIWRWMMEKWPFPERSHLRQLFAGNLVVNSYGSLGIAAEKATKTPGAKWLAEQRHPEHLADGEFWSILAIRGGALLVPARAIYVLGPPNDYLLWEAIEYGNDAARRAIGGLFPHLVKKSGN
ncbi:MAG: hypothetical protein NTV34_04815 [Proteobacteria bacterium]|nr:hypothetical protein [Pseudomonadota bacterium]